VSFGYAISRNLQLRAGVDNLLDTNPPITNRHPGYTPATGATGPGSTSYSEGNLASGVYDALGRSYFVGVRLSF